MHRFEKRLADLEKASAIVEGPTTIVVSFLSSDDRDAEIQTLKDSQGNQQWTRLPGETEQALTDRATKEVSRNGAGCTVLMQVD